MPTSFASLASSFPTPSPMPDAESNAQANEEAFSQWEQAAGWGPDPTGTTVVAVEGGFQTIPLYPSTTASTTSSYGATSTAVTSMSADNAKAGLSEGAKIGIGLGVGLAALFFIGAVTGIMISRKRQRASFARRTERLQVRQMQQPSSGSVIV
ncbi:uncharacterized protein L969DRAFT_23831 [Mixia osmundae IAM 14324]|uniref:Mid2 domain-containing protein n=1 Tax=Mixia osmundae (strain CBS 9802 / IAM 14324 / JCM 22182 / KY 12970) TaxID=764103 RepID=G7E3I8_MIXOS|nr:uncharacterized protein L969DRAFT_23831 [Mixia osmundae IAM 14324]KEI39384.1 hypothetical protein L969DRAFT_23831 [Mixia osmundae IAM 14324]GAA97398.1 hypothetical protein E5Q_04076 [Mixia osmundae IAM 14324]